MRTLGMRKIAYHCSSGPDYLSRAFRILLIPALFFALSLSLPVSLKLPENISYASTVDGFTMEMPLDRDQKLNAIRFLQARIVQPYSNARYLVRNATVLLPESGNEGVFAYLITLQAGGLGNRAYDLSEFYSVAGYYMVLISRDGDNFEMVDEIQLTPSEIVDRLSLGTMQPPPELTSNYSEFDYSDAIFDATNPDLIEWRNHLLDIAVPRWEWKDLTGDGSLDCILDIEGFELKPTSYYTLLVTTSDSFMEGFRSWGYDTLFSETMTDRGIAIVANSYSTSPDGEFVQCWRDYYIWNGFRFAISNENFAPKYNEFIDPLQNLLGNSLAEEESQSGRWVGLTRFEINATRYAENLPLPGQFLFYLARIAEYNGNADEANRRWQELADYLNDEYDSQESIDMENLASLQSYMDWRDELFSAADASLSN